MMRRFSRMCVCSGTVLSWRCVQSSGGALDVTCVVDAIAKICGIRALDQPVRRCPDPEACKGPYGFDRRPGSVAAFRAYVSELKSIDATGLPLQLRYDSRRVPIAANTGSPGSGKSFQLRLLQSLFEHHGVVDSSGGYTLGEQPQGTDCLARGVYVTLNGPSSLYQFFDASSDMTLRVHRRIIHAAAVRAQADKGAQKAAFKIDRFWRLLHAAVSLAGDELDDLLCDEKCVVAICHRLLGTPDTAPLLILFDELRKIDNTAVVTAVSDRCVGALNCLASITQTCTAERVTQLRASGARCPGPVFLVVSAHAAIDVAKGFQTASNRKVYHLPLPPLNLSCGFDATISQIVAGKAGTDDRQKATAQMVVRALAWMHHGNPRQFDFFLDKVTNTKSVGQLTETFFNNEINAMSGDVTSQKASRFLMACSKASPPVNPVDLLRSLFWPCGYSETSPDSLDEMSATLLAQSFGLCSIIRMPDREQDAVYMNPAVAKALCKALTKRPSFFAGARDKAIVEAVASLSEEMTKLPEVPPHFNSGKTYERVIAFAMACRALTARTDVTVDELVLNREPFDRPRLVVLDGLKERGYDCFPRAAVLQETFDDEKKRAPEHAAELDAELANYERNNTAKNGVWYNAEATTLPAAPFYGLPARRYNVCVDHMMVLPYEAAAARETKRVTVLFQEKEWKQGAVVDEGKVLADLEAHMRYGSARKQLQDSDVMVVYVTPNRPSFVRGAKDSRRRVEVVSHDDIREWCPMVAYSACDARVLNEIRNGPSSTKTA